MVSKLVSLPRCVVIPEARTVPSSGDYMIMPQEFFDNWARILSPSEYLVLNAVYRCVNANREQPVFLLRDDPSSFSVGQIEGITNLNRQTVSKALLALREHGILHINFRAGLPNSVEKLDLAVVPSPELKRKKPKPHSENLRAHQDQEGH